SRKLHHGYRKGQEGRTKRLRQHRRSALEYRKMLPRQRDHRSHGSRRVRTTVTCNEEIARRASSGKHLARQVALAAPSMQRQKTQKADDRLRTARVPGKLRASPCLVPVE